MNRLLMLCVTLTMVACNAAATDRNQQLRRTFTADCLSQSAYGSPDLPTHMAGQLHRKCSQAARLRFPKEPQPAARIGSAP